MKNTTRIDRSHLMGVPVRRPGRLVTFPAPLDAANVSECPACNGNGDENHFSPCRACGGSALITCACGSCAAGLFTHDGDTWFACNGARPLTLAEVDRLDRAELLRQGEPAPQCDGDGLPF